MQAVDALLAAASEPVAEPPGPALRDALNELAHLPAEDLVQAIRAIAVALQGLVAPGGAGLLAVWLGPHVERGADPEETADAVLETLLRWARVLPPPQEEEPLPELAMLGQSMVAHLSRSETLLDRLRRREDLQAVLETKKPAVPGGVGFSHESTPPREREARGGRWCMALPRATPPRISPAQLIAPRRTPASQARSSGQVWSTPTAPRPPALQVMSTQSRPDDPLVPETAFSARACWCHPRSFFR